MAYRPHGHAGAQVRGKGPLGICSRCGFLYYLNDLVWQYDYQGGQTPQNLRLLVCRRTCLDGLNYNNKLLILPPDPPPIFNARPEFYDVDEPNWLVTEDADIITTQSGEEFITSIPDPASNAATVGVIAEVDSGGEVVTVLYLDLFNGNPTASGISVLSAITGSSTRINIFANVTFVAGVGTDVDYLTNTEDIVVSDSSASVTNLNYVAFYDAPSGGNLLFYAPSSVFDHGGANIGIGTPVQFNALDLVILDVAGGQDMVSEAGMILITESGADMITE